MGDLMLSGGTLQIELASDTLSETLLVDGAVTLGGTLQISLVGAYAPNEGDSWQIISAGGGIDQAFTSIPPEFSVQKQGNNLMLYYGAAPGLNGDFNNDGVVDAADYLAWRKNDGTLEGYNAWKNNFGASTPGAGGGDNAGGSVPEPALGILFLPVAAMLALVRRRAHFK
jgi:hypothetical protein